MIRFAPKTELGTAPAIKVAKSNANIRSDLELSDASTAAVQVETNKGAGRAVTMAPATVEPAAKNPSLSGELPSKGRKTDSRKRKEVASPKQAEASNPGHGQSVGDLLLDL